MWPWKLGGDRDWGFLYNMAVSGGAGPAQGEQRVFPSSKFAGRRDDLGNVWCFMLFFKSSFLNGFECHEMC